MTPSNEEEREAAAPLAAWVPGSRWVTRNGAGGEDTWTVRTRNGDQLEIQRPSKFVGTVVVQLKIKNNRIIKVTQVRYEDGNHCGARDWIGEGTISGKSLKLHFSVDATNGSNPWTRWEETINLKPE